MSAPLSRALADLPDLLQAHLVLSLAAIALAVGIGLPLAIAASHAPGLRAPVLAIVGVFQTIPGLALLALFYPALVLLGRATGWAVPALGFLPALLALSIYAMLPIVRNAVTAIAGLDPVLRQAADGIGMTARQRLLRVELPLGAPVILAGLRTAAVWTIGTATLATTVGQPSLGDLIFSGLQTENWVRVLVGCGAAAVLALMTDALLGLIERGIARRSKAMVLSGIGALLFAVLLAFVPLSGGNGDADRPAYVVGAKNFSEQYILAALLERRLEAAGMRVERRDNLGSAIAYRAVAAGDIDVYVDYTGTLWANVLNRNDNPDRETMMRVLSRGLMARDGVRVLGSLGFENAYAFAMPAARARALNIADLDDLAAKGPELTLGSDLEFLSRPEWRAVEGAYGMRFGGSTAYSPTFMYRAVANGRADVISAFSSDGRIAALDLVTLADPRGALPRYDAVILLSQRAAQDPELVRALRPLIGAISIARMREANLAVDREENAIDPAAAAAALDADLR
ncbi:ABC transporter permease/substrate-binding protein [uncultured Croceicoccus sp.]|uniref:ABC transporter permease/substrate-binding protein n=1 Tax=uncultured Croceicoccus sp. TaxID=1295329 RepID=UPI00261A16D9|nr:ABC transporter permease/substrate-binding protein [uncultured Croceicoccus sp.]